MMNDEFVKNFAAMPKFKKPRSYKEVEQDMNKLWNINPELCLKLAVYARLITRRTKIVKGSSPEFLGVQQGKGLRNEGILRIMWIAINHPNTFRANIAYFIAAGSWKDIFKMLSLDLQYHGWENRKLNWNFFYQVISAGLSNRETTNLVRKYMPTIRTNKRCITEQSKANTLVGRWLARKLYSKIDKQTAFRIYRSTKSSGLAHQWQQVISKQLYDKLNFDIISRKALTLLANSKFLKNHNLEEKYAEWLKNYSIKYDANDKIKFYAAMKQPLLNKLKVKYKRPISK